MIGMKSNTLTPQKVIKNTKKLLFKREMRYLCLVLVFGFHCSPNQERKELLNFGIKFSILFPAFLIGKLTLVFTAH